MRRTIVDICQSDFVKTIRLANPTNQILLVSQYAFELIGNCTEGRQLTKFFKNEFLRILPGARFYDCL